jgi:hypothetical protein
MADFGFGMRNCESTCVELEMHEDSAETKMSCLLPAACCPLPRRVQRA